MLDTISIVLFCALVAARAAAQPSTIYAPVLASKSFVVGAANPLTGVFFRHPGGDTTWMHTGAKNIRAYGVAVGPASGGRVMYIAAGNGVHLSRDRGLSWKITTGWRITEVTSVVPDARDTNTVYCTTPYGVFKTTDGCATWREMNNGLTSCFASCLVTGVDSRLYCATEDGLFVSRDGGGHWEKTGLSVTGTRTVAAHPSNPAFLIAGTEHDGLFVSRDSGRTWTRSEPDAGRTTFYALAFDPADPDVIYAGGYLTGVYKTTDGARSWKSTNAGLGEISVHGIAVDPADRSRIYAATLWGGIYSSPDGGETWTREGMSGAQVWSIVITPY